MTNNEPVVLTREHAETLYATNYDKWPQTRDPLDDLRRGRTVVVPADELSHLRAEVEKYRGGIHTHGPECWSWGWRHYECAEREIARLRARVAELESCEPVAWRYSIAGEIRYATTREEADSENATKEPEDRWVEPLFLGPQRMAGSRGWQMIETAPIEEFVAVFVPGSKDGSVSSCVSIAKKGPSKQGEMMWWPVDGGWFRDGEPTHWISLPDVIAHAKEGEQG